jgi:hypothetical protein
MLKIWHLTGAKSSALSKNRNLGARQAQYVQDQKVAVTLCETDPTMNANPRAHGASISNLRLIHLSVSSVGINRTNLTLKIVGSDREMVRVAIADRSCRQETRNLRDYRIAKLLHVAIAQSTRSIGVDCAIARLGDAGVAPRGAAPRRPARAGGLGARARGVAGVSGDGGKVPGPA